MFDKIIHFSIHNKLVVGIFTLGLIVCGIYSLTQLPIDAVPDITNNQVQVITQAPTLGAQEVEQYITVPIELEMANIPGLIERRSISRSGISVITLVFKDNVDIYWARTQVNENLQEAEKKIPENTGIPSLAPVTTGLGEIYQYVLHTRKGYEKKYTATDLRTIQDWLVRTQLAGTPGVAEISGWGGYVKQYEVALDNDKLNALNITMPEIYTALEKNNANTGGSYIEQHSNAYFIRGLGVVKSLSDIEKIVVKNVNGIPVLIRDIATVQFGSAIRYGAVTRNGDGEVVAGIALMLKGENFNQVIKNVKARMAQIQKSLPEGVVIEPFIDRTELVNRTIKTVEKNLIEGGLIVIFVLVLLLGNLRAGLLVASVIPLSMLFAFSCMRLFNVSGNLMSLGAIDFGLIVDGAVIIVEAIIHRLTETKSFAGMPSLTKKQMDHEVYTAASKIRSSAAFGEIILLIVYLPLFSLVGIEGKMFKPMAQTVAFAIAGAFILSLTYVPMASALFLSKKTEHRKSISDRIMSGLHRLYEPLLKVVLRARWITIGVAAAMLVITAVVFHRMGGEFIPTLDEGDLTVEVSMMQGTSLTQTIETFTRAEKILKTQFPEIKQIVTRIGSAEIPTDPMPFERGDMMLAMRPRNEWTSARSKPELIKKMEDALSELPGLNFEITQPMQMRFNELMTGVRQQVAIKIYGDDLEVLSAQAHTVADLIGNVKGVADPYVEKVNGLPQIVVSYNRDKIAQYGINISDVNMVLKTAFAGSTAGVVFEGEKRFDIVIRLQKDLRENIVNIENLFVPLPSGNKVPLNQVADISFRDAPAQISREAGKRRIYVGFNVRGRDIESTVKEIRQLLDNKLQMPSGYYLTYGGDFQNLTEAKQRLGLALPVALALILVLLYFTFRSIPQMLLICSAIPLSAIGGVLALSLRGMHFSISAGVGFIALFGVAVLNGIVLIGQFNQLKAEGMKDIYQRIMEGTRIRLRPVVMTAAVASLGFLPMALSNSAGAEVQKPLATVVIGGLLTATLLTLFVLPCLYLIFSGRKSSRSKLPVALIIGIISLCTPAITNAQSVPVTLPFLQSQAERNNLEQQSAALEIDQSKAQERTALDPGKTNFRLMQDPTSGGNIDNAIGITQSFAWPGLYGQQKKLLQAQTVLAEKSLQVSSVALQRNVQLAWNEYLYAQARIALLQYQDSLYKKFLEKSTVRYGTGETSKLEKLTALNKYQEVKLQLNEARADAQIAQFKIKQLTGYEDVLVITDTLSPLPFDVKDDKQANPTLAYYQQQQAIAGHKVRVERSKLLPELTLGYSHQLLINGFNPAHIDRQYFPGTRVGGIEIGVAVPLFYGAGKARVQSERIGEQIAAKRLAYASASINSQYQQAFQDYLKYKTSIDYYQDEGLAQLNEQMRVSQAAFNLGEIGYVEFFQNMTLATQSKLLYLSTLNAYNQSIIHLNYLKGGQ